MVANAVTVFLYKNRQTLIFFTSQNIKFRGREARLINELTVFRVRTVIRLIENFVLVAVDHFSPSAFSARLEVLPNLISTVCASWRPRKRSGNTDGHVSELREGGGGSSVVIGGPRRGDSLQRFNSAADALAFVIFTPRERAEPCVTP